MLKVGDIVQITDKSHPWYPCLLLIDEVKNWGIQAYALIPESNDGSQPVRSAYNRLYSYQIAFVGKATITPG